MMTVQQATQQLISQLRPLYELREAGNIADLVMEHLTQWKKIDRILFKTSSLSIEKEDLLQDFISQLASGKPVQYVLRQAWFCGLKFYVDEQVLVPRPETEELVNWVSEEALKITNSALATSQTRILDIGTGSGCIPIVLKKSLPEVEVFSCDVSAVALAIARKNAAFYAVDVRFIECDFLDPVRRNDLPLVDILVSNPPYIPSLQKESMHRNVTSYEPHLALFVPDQDPLVFYKALISFASQAGEVIVFAEIHEDAGTQVWKLFQDAAFTGIELRDDMQGKQRMIRAVSAQTGK